MGLATLDFLVIILYLAGMIVFGLLVSGRQKSADDYFLGGRRIPWWAVLFSVVATETSTLTFISIPALGYGGSLTFLQITFGYILGRVAASLLLLPKYYRGRISTAYEYLGIRFGRGMRTITSTTFMVTRLLADGVRLFASAIPVALILRLAGVPLGILEVYLLSILLIAATTLAYTYWGGIRAVVWMDVLQMGVYIGGAFLAAAVLLSRIPGGPGAALHLARSAGKLKLLDPGLELSLADFLAQPYTLITAVVGGAVFSIASHGTDQLIVQRLLATRNLRSSQKALVGSGIVVFLQFSLFLGIGLLLYAFYGGADPSRLQLATADEVFAKFIVEELPAGVSGLIVAAVLAAAMSTLSSSINSLASSTTMDLVKPFRGRTNPPEKDLKTSRMITLSWGAVIAGSASLIALLQLQNPAGRPAVVELGLGIATYTYGGLLGAFLLAAFSRKPRFGDAVAGFFTGLTALLFLVEGPVQALLPGKGLHIAWPLYTVVGSSIVLLAGHLSFLFRVRVFQRLPLSGK